MKILVMCRPSAGVDPTIQIAPLTGQEIGALLKLRDTGLLVNAYSPNGPGAVLFFDCLREDVESALLTLPLVREQLVDTEIIELIPFPGL